MSTFDKSTAPPKSVFKSKTVIINVIVALSSLYAPVQRWVQAHPTETLIGLGLLNTGLRYITKGRVTLFEE